MAGLKYTGRADVLSIDGRTYRRADGDFDKPIQISKARAAQMAAGSRLHSFEDADGDVLETATAPTNAPSTPAQARAADKS